jgi:hypothetical protein
LVALAAGCTNGDSVTQPKNNIDAVPWRLDLNYKAIVTSVGASVQLQATPVNADGEPLTGLPPVEWSVTDTSLNIDQTGKITAHQPQSSIIVYATIHSIDGNWTIADTARVTVFDHPFAFSSFKMVLDGPTVLSAGDWRNFDAVLFDANGKPLKYADVDPTDPDTVNNYLPITYYTPSVGKDIWSQYNRWNGGASANNFGDFTLAAKSLIFGNVYTDTVNFRVTWPDSGSLYIYRVTYNLDPSPSIMSQTDITILQGGIVNFRNYNGSLPADIVFDDQTHVINGNMPSLVLDYQGENATFPYVGKYTYHSSLGFHGTVTVVSPDTPPPGAGT